jgi:hypothetical protein
MTTTRLAIVCDLCLLEQLMKEYVDEELRGDEYVLDQMRLGHFLLWLTIRQRQETTNGEVCTQPRQRA